MLWAFGALEVWTLVVLLLAFGAFSVFAFAATQSLLPHLVPRDRLVVANARLDQSDAAAQTLGPALGGGLVGLLGAPVAIAVDAVSYLVDAVLNTGLRVDESPPDHAGERRLRREISEGVRWTYRHPTLAPLAVSTHVWFVANAAGFTALTVVVLRQMGLSGLVFGLLVASSGVASLVGATVALMVGRRLGTGPAIIATRSIHPVAWILVAAAPHVPNGVVLLGGALVLQGLAMGVENANDTGYWQMVTPDRLLGRANATRRSANRSAGALGAVLGGLALTLFDEGLTLIGVAALSAVSAMIVGLSPMRTVCVT
ncbi:MFS transporter [Nocardioides terrisoli]|uniref:MFS transporter n=1 Tax=Nocardioides terrisoli TaxID=3388267 RepID=UPI00287BA389|nr:MFS transporter [Nocardioides marmorisolisilvae]